MRANLLLARESPGTKYPFLPQLQDGSLFLAQDSWAPTPASGSVYPVGRNVGLQGYFLLEEGTSFPGETHVADAEVLSLSWVGLCIDLQAHCHCRFFIVFNPESIVHHASKNGQESNTLFLNSMVGGRV